MPTSVSSGSQTAVVSTEHTLVTDTTAQTYVLVTDCTNLAMGDTVELRLYTKCKSGSAERLAYLRSYRHAQGEPVKYSVPVPADVSIRATLTQTAGSARVFDWNLLRI